MRKTLLLCGVLMLIGASVALAAAPGVNLGWSTDLGCWPESGTADKTFACNSNTGNSTMVASFAIGVDMPDYYGVQCILDGQSESATLPDWWQLSNTGSCRPTALSTSADFTTAPQSTCVDAFLGLAQGGIGAYQTEQYPPPQPLNVPAPNRLRLKVAYGIVDPVAITAGTEYYAFRATVTNAKTVGSPSCAGCATAVTMVLNEIRVVPTLQANAILLYNASANQCITWQATTVPCASVPTRNRTWGEVKALYR